MRKRTTRAQAGKKDFIDVGAISKADIEALLTSAALLKDKQRRGKPHPLLPGKTLGLLFPVDAWCENYAHWAFYGSWWARSG